MTKKIILEDVMVLEGFAIVVDPVFTLFQSLKMIKVEKKLIHTIGQQTTRNKKGGVYTSA